MSEGLCEKYSRFRPRLVILFGSYTRGDYTESSDVDVLIVSDLFPRVSIQYGVGRKAL